MKIEYAQYDKAVHYIQATKETRIILYYFYSDMLVYDGWLEIPKTVLYDKRTNGLLYKYKISSCDKAYDAIMSIYRTGTEANINTYKPIF